MSARVALAAAVLVLLAAGLAVRLDGITGPPFDNAVARQFHGAILARTYFVDTDELTAARRAVVAAWRDEVKPIEPPIMEHLAALTYRLTGHERLWLGRLLSVVWWIAGGACLFRISLRLHNPAGVLATTAVFLSLPFAVLASRAFQPDPLLVAAIVTSILALLRYDESPSLRRLAVAATALAVAFLVKPGIAPPLLLPLLVVLTARRARTAVATTAALLVSTLPMFAWYAYGTLAHSFLRGHFSAKIKPSLLLERSYWNGWWDQLAFVLTYPLKSGTLALLLLLAALAGVAVSSPRTRTLLISLWAGYALYGLLFTVHISTHNYYSLPLVPIVALSLGSLVDAAARLSHVPQAAAAGVVLAAAVVTALAVSWKLHGPLTDTSFRAEQALYEAAGRASDHTARALYVDTHYAEPARYYGWTAGTLLTSGYERGAPGLARRTLAAEVRADPPPAYLIFTGAGLRRRLAGFDAEIASRYAARIRTADLAVYDLTRRAQRR